VSKSVWGGLEGKRCRGGGGVGEKISTPFTGFSSGHLFELFLESAAAFLLTATLTSSQPSPRAGAPRQPALVLPRLRVIPPLRSSPAAWQPLPVLMAAAAAPAEGEARCQGSRQRRRRSR
jgi:hypothetical protein